MKTTSLVLAALLALAPVRAWSQEHSHAAGEAAQALMQANDAMMSSMADAKPSGDPDTGFVTMMIPHHQGAIDMAKVQLRYGTDPKLRAMAERIIVDQEKEIAEMEAWQSEHAH